MKKAEKQQRFHQAFINIFYPPQSSPHEAEDRSVTAVPGNSYPKLDFDTDDSEEKHSTDDTNASVPQKLTRAQRKRIRRRKVKETASCRRKIIGPLLPPAHEKARAELAIQEKVQGNVNEAVEASHVSTCHESQ